MLTKRALFQMCEHETWSVRMTTVRIAQTFANVCVVSIDVGTSKEICSSCTCGVDWNSWCTTYFDIHFAYYFVPDCSLEFFV